ncbi:MAG: branched-chain amino acid ABC transporter permease [Conexivisphaera sp.]
MPLALAATVPAWGGSLLEGFLTLALIYGASALLWGFLAEYAGVVSLGQQLFIGIGAYGLVIFGRLGLPTFPAILASAALSSLVAAAVAFPLLRLRGAYFALGTWIVAEIFQLAFNNWGYVGAGAGVTYGPALSTPDYLTFYLSLALMAAASVVVFQVYKSRLGLALRAIGADEEAAAESGVKVFRTKALAFVISGAMTSVAGSAYALYAAYLIPNSIFSISWIIGMIFIAVIGGMGRVFGASVGSLIFVGLTYATSAYAGWSPLLEGLMTIVAWLILPRGVWGEVASRIGLRPPA